MNKELLTDFVKDLLETQVRELLVRAMAIIGEDQQVAKPQIIMDIIQDESDDDSLFLPSRGESEVE